MISLEYRVCGKPETGAALLRPLIFNLIFNLIDRGSRKDISIFLKDARLVVSFLDPQVVTPE